VLEARTLEVAAGGPARDGDLLWRGPARDLVDVYLWSAPARGGPGLADLLARGRARPQLAVAAAALVVRDERAPWSLAGGASAALAHAAGELLREAAPETAGLLHTSFAASEGYGLGPYPASDLYRGEGVELGLSIAAAAAADLEYPAPDAVPDRRSARRGGHDHGRARGRSARRPRRGRLSGLKQP
jgi:hypothetical protein